MAIALKKQAQYLTQNGFTEQQANALVYFQKDFIEDHLATKMDIEMVRKEIEMVRKDLTKEIEMVRKDLTIRLGSIMVGGIIVLSIIMKLMNS